VLDRRAPRRGIGTKPPPIINARARLAGNRMTPSYLTRIFLPLLLAFCLVAVFPRVSDAQVERRVVFAKGKTSATMRGRLPANFADYDAYIIRGRRGQTLSIKLTTTDRAGYLSVFETKELGPDEDMITPEGEYPRLWSGRLPITSEYSVQVYGSRNIDQRSSRASYTLEITIR
jgi:hypothetical protein